METLSYVQLMERYLKLVDLVEHSYYEGWVNAGNESPDETWRVSNTKQKLEDMTK